MNTDETIRAFAEIDCSDKERAHVQADELLLAFLRAAGYSDVADAWTYLEDRLDGFWYA